MERLLGLDFKRADNTIAGIPVDSEYIIFVIDTSGSMYGYAWRLVREKGERDAGHLSLREGHPSDERHGRLHVRSVRWPLDQRFASDPPQHRGAHGALGTCTPIQAPWRASSAPSTCSMRTTRRSSIYVFGDDFQGHSIEEVVDSVDRKNRVDENRQPTLCASTP